MATATTTTTSSLSGTMGIPTPLGIGAVPGLSSTMTSSTTSVTGTTHASSTALTSSISATIGTPSYVQNTIAGTSGAIFSLPGTAQTGTTTVFSSTTSVPTCSTASSAEFRMTEEETLFLRLTSLVLKIALKAVRCFFDNLIPPSNLTQTLTKEEKNLLSLKDRGILLGHQWDTLYPPQGTASSSDFDLTLMILLIRNLIKIKEPKTGWSNLPATTDNSPGAQIARIKYYRNSIAHTPSCSISKNDFTKSWQEVSQAVIGIGGQVYQLEISALLIASLDQSYKDLYREVKNLVLHSVVPVNIERLQKLKLEFWEKEDKTFVTTRATQALETSIDQNNVTLIKGPPGSGKTANAHHIALKYKQKGYQIFNVQSIEKIFDLWMPEGSQLFVLDDIFGIHKADESELHRWKKCKEDLTLMFDNSCIKILATIRSYIHQDALLEFLEYQAVDISSSDISLTNEEREEMFSKYSSYQERDDLSGFGTRVKDYNIYCFPLLCRRFTAEKISNYSIEDFFNKPLSELIGKELQDFSVNEKVRYFCLLYCMMNDNCIEVDMVSLADKEDKTKTVRENLLKICKLPVSLPVTEIKSKLDTLLNTYLKREGDTYQFIHDIVHDAIVQHVNQLPLEIKRLILKHSTPNFIKDRTHLGSIDKSASQAAIVITKDLEDAWGDCELNCIKEGHWNEVFENTCIRTKQADEILTRSLNRLGDRSIKKFANNCKGKLDKRVLSVKLLSEYTLSIESKLSGEDCTILHFSVLLGLLDFTKSLLRFINVFKKHVINHHLNLLLLACLSGNVEMVLLFKKYGLNKYSSGKLTPLFLSSGLGNDVIVKTLIEYGSSVNTRNTVQKQTPLFIASRYGHDKVVKLLIKSGAAINKSDSDGNSALHIACLQSYADIVKLLIEAGVDVKKPNRHGDSALSSACLNSTTDMVRLLIEAGMDVKNPNSDGDSALYMACLNSNTDMVRLLIEAGMDVKNSNIDGYSALSMACMNNNTDLVKLLIEAGVDVKKPNSDGDSALYLACFNRNADIVRLLIEAGMDVKNPNSDGYSALSIACLGSDADIVKLLIDAGVDVNKSDRLGDSALHTACRQSNADIVKLLIKAGVDANKPDSDGNSALYIACRHSNPDIVNLLIEAGVDVTKSDGDYALHIAAQRRRNADIEKLLDARVDVNSA